MSDPRSLHTCPKPTNCSRSDGIYTETIAPPGKISTSQVYIMIHTFTELSLPVKSWADHIDSGTWKQIDNLSTLECVHRHIALMPDCHEGFGIPIGCVVACKDAVIPNAVGVDIGCGMCALRTNISTTELDHDTIARIIHNIRREIPLGFAHHTSPRSWEGFNDAPDLDAVTRELPSAAKQLGTLGGGNHFIELQKDEWNNLWCMLHTGSRNFGYKVAAAYHRHALEYCNAHNTRLPTDSLAWVPLSSRVAKDYCAAMDFTLAFARENRDRIKKHCIAILARHTDCRILEQINIHHNFAARERHFGSEYMIHRKGATRAFRDQSGIIPGSMGNASFIVRGKDNPESFASCSHGAGRTMSRRAANKTLTLADVQTRMKGIVWEPSSLTKKAGKKTGKYDLSEAPQAYKNIDEVIALQQDCIEVLYRLTPLGVVKG